MNVKCHLFFIAVLNSFNAIGCEIKVGIREIPPYSFQNELFHWQGSDIDLLKEISTILKCDIQFLPVSFGEGLNLLKDGKIDAMSQLSKLPERSKSIHFVGPIRSEKFTLVTDKKINEEIIELETISKLPYIFAKRRGTYLGSEFENLYKFNKEFANKFIEIANSQPRIDLVLKGRVVGFFEESNFKDYQLKYVKKYQALKQHPLEIISGDVYLGLSKKTISKTQLKMINQYLFQRSNK